MSVKLEVTLSNKEIQNMIMLKLVTIEGINKVKVINDTKQEHTESSDEQPKTEVEDKLNAKMKAVKRYQEKNKDRLKEYRKAYYLKNKERILKYQNEYNKKETKKD